MVVIQMRYAVADQVLRVKVVQLGQVALKAHVPQEHHIRPTLAARVQLRVHHPIVLAVRTHQHTIKARSTKQQHAVVITSQAKGQLLLQAVAPIAHTAIGILAHQVQVGQM